MSDCSFSTLPEETCAHCTGAQIEPGEISLLETDYQTGQAFDKLLPEARIFSALKDGYSRRRESDEAIQAEILRTSGPGKFNSVPEVYGGDDGQVDFEAIEPDEDSP